MTDKEVAESYAKAIKAVKAFGDAFLELREKAEQHALAAVRPTGINRGLS